MKVIATTLNIKFLGVFTLAAFLAACTEETPQKAEVVYQETGPCNVEGSVAHFKQGQKDQVFFAFDKSKILEENTKVPAMKDFLCKYNKAGSIVGHCDRVGTAEYNLALGQRRSDALAKSLIKHGLPANKICAKYSVGNQRLLVAGTTPECDAANRTAIFILNNDGAGAGMEATPAAPADAASIDAAPAVVTSAE